MKKIFLIAALLFTLVSCETKDLTKRDTTIRVVYMNGDIDTITYVHQGNDFYLLEGDLRATNGWEGLTLVSYVRDYNILESKNQ